jgi:hypothetical protein
MRNVAKTLMRCSIASIVGLVALLWSGNFMPNEHSSLVSSADARIGRPLTPVSYAGVARRTTRRAVAVGAVGTGAAVVVAPAPVVVAPAVVCRQVVDAYGRIVRVCR